MFEFISTLFGSTHHFADGSVIKPINRDEFLYIQPDGKSVVAYVYKTGPEADFDRVILRSSIESWLGDSLGAENKILPEKRQEIICKLLKYKKFKGDKVGLE